MDQYKIGDVIYHPGMEWQSFEQGTIVFLDSNDSELVVRCKSEYPKLLVISKGVLKKQQTFKRKYEKTKSIEKLNDQIYKLKEEINKLT